VAEQAGEYTKLPTQFTADVMKAKKIYIMQREAKFHFESDSTCVVTIPLVDLSWNWYALLMDSCERKPGNGNMSTSVSFLYILIYTTVFFSEHFQ